MNEMNEKLTQKRLKLTPESQAWLTMALDPFHDYEIPIAGMPDSDTEKTVVQYIKRTTSITAPSGISSTEKWNCQIATLPTMCTSSINEAVNQRPNDPVPNFDSTFVGNTFGTITVTAAVEQDPSEDLWPGVSSAKVANHNSTDFIKFGISPTDNGNANSMMKIIGGGFEVTDVSNYTVKQGSVSVGSIPQGYSQYVPCELLTDDTSTVHCLGNIRLARAPPKNTADAGLVPNARTWEAQDGVYVPLRLDTSSWSGFTPQSSGCFAVSDNDDMLLTTPDNVHIHSPCGITYTVPYSQTRQVSIGGTPTNIVFASNTDRDAHIETSYAHFSGLAHDAVLQLVSIFIVEIAPTPANVTLLSMASSSALYEPKALELYSRMLTQLPPGTKVGNNASGDWFRTVLRTAGQVASAIAPIIPNPAVKAIVGGSGAILSSIPKPKPQGKAPNTSRPEKPKDKKPKSRAKKQH
jgi:hypothetical protein